MAYIGFYLVMAGLAAAGGALDHGTGMATAIAMTAAGAVLMWLFREEDESEDEEEDNGVVSRGGSHVDKPAGDGKGRHAADSRCGSRQGIYGDDDRILPRDHYSNRDQTAGGHLCRAP